MICSNWLIPGWGGEASFAQHAGLHQAIAGVIRAARRLPPGNLQSHCLPQWPPVTARDGERRRTNDEVWHGVINVRAYRKTMCCASTGTNMFERGNTKHDIGECNQERRGEGRRLIARISQRSKTMQVEKMESQDEVGRNQRT